LLNLLLKTNLLVILSLTSIDLSCQQTASQIGLGAGFGYLKEEFNYSSSTQRAFRHDRTGFYSFQYIRPEKTFRGSAELYYQDYLIKLNGSETTNNQYSAHGSVHRYNYWVSRFSAEVKRIGLVTALNVRFTNEDRKLKLFGKLGIGLEQTIHKKVYEDYNRSIYSSSSRNPQTGETYSSITVIPNTPVTASEAWNHKLNRTTVIFNPALRFHWKLNSKFEMCNEIGNRIYLNAYPGKIGNNFLVKTIYLGMTVLYNLPIKE
jgi:hypothetical protein